MSCLLLYNTTPTTTLTFERFRATLSNAIWYMLLWESKVILDIVGAGWQLDLLELVLEKPRGEYSASFYVALTKVFCFKTYIKYHLI